MLAFAWSVYPAEGVGIIGGTRSGFVKSVHKLQNLAPQQYCFADPYEQYLAIRKIRRSQERLIATFHSHPEGGATLSNEDRQHLFDVAPTAIVIGMNAHTKSTQVLAYARTQIGTEDSVEIVVR